MYPNDMIDGNNIILFTHKFNQKVKKHNTEIRKNDCDSNYFVYFIYIMLFSLNHLPGRRVDLLRCYVVLSVQPENHDSLNEIYYVYRQIGETNNHVHTYIHTYV